MRKLTQHPDYLYARFSNVFVAVVRGQPTLEMVETMESHMLDIRRESDRGIGFMLIKMTGAPVPQGMVRKRAVRMFQTLRQDLRAFAGISEGTGFWSSATRAAMMTITLFGRTPYPMKIFGTVETGSRWILDQFALCTTRESWVGFQTDLRDLRSAWEAPTNIDKTG